MKKIANAEEALLFFMSARVVKCPDAVINRFTVHEYKNHKPKAHATCF